MSYQRWIKPGKLDSLKGTLGAVGKGTQMLTFQLQKEPPATMLCFWTWALILLSNLAHLGGQLFVQLSGVLILHLFQEAASLSRWPVMLPESKGCHAPCCWDA